VSWLPGKPGDRCPGRELPALEPTARTDGDGREHVQVVWVSQRESTELAHADRWISVGPPPVALAGSQRRGGIAWPLTLQRRVGRSPARSPRSCWHSPKATSIRWPRSPDLLGPADLHRAPPDSRAQSSRRAGRHCPGLGSGHPGLHRHPGFTLGPRGWSP